MAAGRPHPSSSPCRPRDICFLLDSLRLTAPVWGDLDRTLMAPLASHPVSMKYDLGAVS